MPTHSKQLLPDTCAAHRQRVSEAGGERATAELRSFGRRRGRRLSAHQLSLLNDGLPRVSLDLAVAAPQSLASLFPTPICEVWLEAGFGGGEHLVWQARQNPHVGFIGCEPFEEGIVKVLAAIKEYALTNIRLYADDARPLLRWLPDRSLQRAFILFPDPWPKKRHVKRRLLARPLLELVARVMAPGGELRVATDIGDYARTILLNIRAQSAFEWRAGGPADWRKRGSDWPQTRYEAKAAKEGRRCYFFRFCRTVCP
ncbi:MAG: tRNA (guanosine(46)-N7)-methyltransferase TrmB [Hyphomicrobium sp.]